MVMKKENFVKVTPKEGNPVVVPASNAEWHKKQGSKVEEATDDDIAVFFPNTEKPVSENVKKAEALEAELKTKTAENTGLEVALATEKESHAKAVAEIAALTAELEALKAEKTASEAGKPEKK